jgi:hypothetical protein
VPLAADQGSAHCAARRILTVHEGAPGSRAGSRRRGHVLDAEHQQSLHGEIRMYGARVRIDMTVGADGLALVRVAMLFEFLRATTPGHSGRMAWPSG